jgi:hypothetical protein
MIIAMYHDTSKLSEEIHGGGDVTKTEEVHADSVQGEGLGI